MTEAGGTEGALCSTCELRAPRPGFKTCEACAARARRQTRAYRVRKGHRIAPCAICDSTEHWTIDCPDGAAKEAAPAQEAAPAAPAPALRAELSLPVLPPLPESEAELLAQLDALRPKTRGDCAAGPRPCPWVRCRHHLLTEQRIFRPRHRRSPAELAAHLFDMPETCTLDLADRGPQILDTIGEVLGVVRERARQLEQRAIAAAQETDLADLAELAADQPEVVDRWEGVEGGASLVPAEVDRGMAKAGVPRLVPSAPRPTPRRLPAPAARPFPVTREEPIMPPSSSASTPPEERVARARPLSLVCQDTPPVPRILSGLPGFDRVLGGGLMPGSIVLIGGEPGVGKSTLLLHALNQLAQPQAEGGAPRAVLYVTGEETLEQAAQRALRLGATAPSLHALAETRLEAILREAAALQPAVLAIDSIQTIDAGAPGRVGGLLQVRAAIDRLVPFAKARGVVVLLIGHVTKNAALAGPKSMEHYVDVVLHFDSEGGARRLLWAPRKNRFGSTQEAASFVMGGGGLTEAGGAAAARQDREDRDDQPAPAAPFRRAARSPLAAHLDELLGVVPESVSSVDRTAEDLPAGGSTGPAMIAHRLLLRPGVVATCQLPVDLSHRDASRLGRFLALLPFADGPEAAAPEADPRELESDVLFAALVKRLHAAHEEAARLRARLASEQETTPAAAPPPAPHVHRGDRDGVRAEIVACLRQHTEGLNVKAMSELIGRSVYLVGQVAREMREEGTLHRTGGERGPGVRYHAPAPAPAPAHAEASP